MDWNGQFAIMTSQLRCSDLNTKETVRSVPVRRKMILSRKRRSRGLMWICVFPESDQAGMGTTARKRENRKGDEGKSHQR